MPAMDDCVISLVVVALRSPSCHHRHVPPPFLVRSDASTHCSRQHIYVIDIIDDVTTEPPAGGAAPLCFRPSSPLWMAIVLHCSFLLQGALFSRFTFTLERAGSPDVITSFSIPVHPLKYTATATTNNNNNTNNKDNKLNLRELF